jgi:hypothetical protein
VESTNEEQRIATVRVYDGADAEFELYRDDGNTYAYEQGTSDLTHLRWSRATGKLQRSGASLPVGSAAKIQVIGRAAN